MKDVTEFEVPKFCTACSGCGEWFTAPGLESKRCKCRVCHGTGSIDRKPETKEQPMSEAKDKHGRIAKVGDLAGYGGKLVRVLSLPDEERFLFLRGALGVEHNGWQWKETGAYGPLLWEILSRGRPEDPVPERFEPERDAEGRPVLCECRNDLPWHEHDCPLGKAIGECYAAPPAVEATPAEPDQHTRYLAFDKRVREIVAEEAPTATVVTDFAAFRNPRPAEARAAGFVAWIDFGLGVVEEMFAIAHNQVDEPARLHCSVGRDRLRDKYAEIGKREVGKR